MTISDEKNLDNPLILVVDDEPDIRKLIQFSLNRIGFKNILTANNGKEAVDKATKHMPDLILLDILMPVMDGFTACSYLKNNDQLKHIPIIIVSALSDMKNKAMAYKCGANDYLAKPLDIITLAARTKAILETQKLREQVRRLSDL